MKRSIIFFLILIPIFSQAQYQVWEDISASEVDDLFGYWRHFSDNRLHDYEGNQWTLNRKSLYKEPADGSPVIIYDNFPLNDSRTQSYTLTNSGDGELAFRHYSTYKGVKSYLGYYDGESLRFFSDTSMNLGITGEYIRNLSQTQDNIWFGYGRSTIVRFDKTNEEFIKYDEESGVFEGELSYPSIQKGKSSVVVFNSNKKPFIFSDGDSDWSPLLPDDSVISYHNYGNGPLSMLSDTKFYQYDSTGLSEYKLNDVHLLGELKEIQELEDKGWVVNYENGFVLVKNKQATTHIYSEFTNDPGLSYFSDTSRTYFLDNGYLVLRFESYDTDKSYFFTELDGKVELKTTSDIKNSNSYLYQELNGDFYFYYPSYNYQSQSYLNIVKNGVDTTTVNIPAKYIYANFVVDSNYIFLHKSWVDAPNTARMSRDELLIKGKIFYDSNQNGIQDTGEKGYNKLALTIQPAGLKVFPSSSGDFAFAGEPGEKYSLIIEGDSIVDYISAPLPYVFKSLDSNKVGLTTSGSELDVKTNFYLPWPRCNTSRLATLNIENSGFASIEKVEAKLVPDPKVTAGSNDATETFGDTLVFRVNNLDLTDNEKFVYQIDWPSADFMNEDFTFKLITDIYDNGEVVKSQADSISTMLRCSYDPNDKAVTPAGVTDEKFTLKESVLNYLVRFENTGNDTAYHVTIYDTLDTDLNWNTLKVLGSSHEMITNIDAEGVVKFYFENIMLPDSTTNKEKAQGFVRFSVAPKSDIAEAAVIKNKAGIVFDQNDPVITNEVKNTMVTTIPTITNTVSFGENNFEVFPNPASSVVKVTGDVGRVEVYNSMGQLVKASKTAEVETADLPDGVYIIKIYSDNEEYQGSEKVLIKN